MKKTNYIFIIIAVIIFLFLKLYRVNITLDYNKWTIAHVLLTQKIWYQNSIEDYHFNPVYTFNNKSDKNIDNLGGLEDTQGNYYYISYPPFSFILPYLVFKFLRVIPGLLPFYLFNVFLQLITALFIYLTVNLILKKSTHKQIFLPSFLALFIYLFSTGISWFYINIYFADTLAHTFFVIAVYLILTLTLERKLNSVIHLIILGIVTFLLVYTEWIGVFFSLLVVLFALKQRSKDKNYFKLIIVSLISTALPLTVTFYQYSLISNSKELISELVSKFSARSSISPSILNVKSYLDIIYFYKTYYLTEAILIVISAFIFFIFMRKEKKLLTKSEAYFSYFSLLPIVLHYVILFNFNSHHSYSVLKTSLFISGLIACLLVRIRKFTIYLLIFYVLMIIIGNNLNTLKETESYDYQEASRKLLSLVKQDETIFICNYPENYIEPQLLYYSERNIRVCKDIEEAEAIRKRLKIDNAVILLTNEKRDFILLERLE